MSALNGGDIFRTDTGEILLVCRGQNLVGRSQVFVMLESGKRRFLDVAELNKKICNVADFEILNQEPDETVGRFLQLVRNHETGKRFNGISG
jgi:hypothetical protein